MTDMTREAVVTTLLTGPYQQAAPDPSLFVPTYVDLLSQRIAVIEAENLHVEAEGEPGEDGHAHAHKVYGVYDAGVQTITLDSDLAFERQRDTFLHENIHAMLAITNLDDLMETATSGDFVEHFVTALAPVLLAWMRDNPASVAYLQERA